MSSNRHVPIHQIIAFVFFVSAALITSLFIFHIKHQSASPLLSQQRGVIFPAARDIKAFALVAADNKKFTLKDFYHHWTLLFFGFTHCASICPTTLDTLNRVYLTLHEKYPTLQVVLISVDPERDTPMSLAQYVQAFNPAFIGVTGNIQALHQLQSQLGIYVTRAAETAANTYQIQHSAAIFLINPQGKWAGLLNDGLKPTELTQAFSESMDRLHG